MPNYNFIDLSPVDFEELSRDLLQKHFGVFLESFKEGRDEGIDFRYSNDSENSIIVQCKRYNSFSSLNKALKHEYKKVLKLSPKRYAIVTSVPLTPAQKTNIKKIFKGINLFLKDIFGRKDINNLLNQYPEVEKNHYKLWLNSTVVLEKILHTGIHNRSDFEKEEIEREIKIYVNNESNQEATSILNLNNYVVISGIPGIGKTTLARMLIYNFLLEDWELIPISSDIKEAEDVYQKGKKQVFYYDDFLGTNFLAEFITKNEDKRILMFIERVKRSKDKKLILTTREYILNQAIQKYESLQDKSLDIGKCTLDLKKYNKLIKGKILYNHLFYSELDTTFFQDILMENRFLKIINHRNYSPRIIQYLTDRKFLGDVSCDKYFNFFIENLANPQHIWRYAFDSHISSVSRYLLIVFLSLGEPVFKEDLYQALNSFFEINEKHYGIKINRVDYDKSLRECERTFIIIEKTVDLKILLRFQNPSIKDFLINYLNEYNELVKHIVNGAIYFNQFFEIFTTNKYFRKVYIDDTLQRLFFVKLKKTLYTISTSTLTQRFNPEDFSFYWIRRNYSKIERLESISSFFDLSISKNVLEFLYNEFSNINLEEELNNIYELNNCIELIKNINEQKKMKGEIILEKIFNEENLKSFENIIIVEKLRDIFPEEYNCFNISHVNKIINLIENVIEEEYSNIEYSTNKDEITEFVEQITVIENLYDLEFQGYRTMAKELEDKIEDENKEKIKTKGISTTTDQSMEDDVLINIFKSLNSRV